MGKEQLLSREREEIRDLQYQEPSCQEFYTINDDIRNLACKIMRSCPDSRQRQSAITKLEMVRIFANAAMSLR